MFLGGAAAVTAVILLSVITAAAASLGGLGTGGLGAGSAAVASCDPDGVDVSYGVNGSTVESVTVTGVAPSCAGGVMRAALADSTGASLGTGGPATVSGSSLTLTLSPQPQASAVAGVHVSISGP